MLLGNKGIINSINNLIERQNMLMTESQLRMIIKKSIILEEKNKKEDAAENNEDLTAVVEELEEMPAGFFSKLETIVDKDVKNAEEQPMGDESLIILAASTLVSGPIIMKGIKWIAKKMAAGLQKLGLNDAGEDVWWTGLAMDDPNCWYHKWHHFYQSNCEAMGKLILKLFGNSEPTEREIHQAGNVVFLTCVIVMGIMSGAGVLHALHDHKFWLTCGETLISCIESTEVLMLLSTICAVAMGHDINKHAEEHGIESTVSA